MTAHPAPASSLEGARCPFGHTAPVADEAPTDVPQAPEVLAGVEAPVGAGSPTGLRWTPNPAWPSAPGPEPEAAG